MTATLLALPSQARRMRPDELAARHIAVEDLCGTSRFRLAMHGTIFFESKPVHEVAEVVLEAAALLVLDDVRGERHGAPAIGTIARRKAGMFSLAVTHDMRLTSRRRQLLGRFRALRRHYKEEAGL